MDGAKTPSRLLRLDNQHLEQLINEEADLERHIERGKNKKIYTTNLDFRSLKDIYRRISKELNKRFPDATVRTSYEIHFERYLKANTKIQFFRSYWIGVKNIDFFITSIGGTVGSRCSRRRGHGLAIEVDGPVHYLESKGRKDSVKCAVLDRLGIIHCVIPNSYVQSSGSRRIVEGIRTAPKIYHRDKIRLLRKIYMETIAQCGSHVERQKLSEMR